LGEFRNLLKDQSEDFDQRRGVFVLVSQPDTARLDQVMLLVALAAANSPQLVPGKMNNNNLY
jgi:hypothetical protein